MGLILMLSRDAMLELRTFSDPKQLRYYVKSLPFRIQSQGDGVHIRVGEHNCSNEHRAQLWLTMAGKSVFQMATYTLYNGVPMLNVSDNA